LFQYGKAAQGFMACGPVGRARRLQSFRRIASTRVAHRAFRLSQQTPRHLNSSDHLSKPKIAHVDTGEVKLSVSSTEPFFGLKG